MRLRKYFKKLRNVWTNERETGKTATNFIYSSQLLKSFLVLHIYFYVMITHVSAHKFYSRYFDCARELAFRQTGDSHLKILFSLGQKHAKKNYLDMFYCLPKVIETIKKKIKKK